MDDLSTNQEQTVLEEESIQKPDEEVDNIVFFTSSTSVSDPLESQTETIEDACRIAKDNLRNLFFNKFLQLIKESDFEFGFSSPAEEYVSEALNRYGSFAREWINELFNKNFYNPNITSSILRIIAHFDYRQISPQGVNMAITATLHKSVEVQECGIRCFENWEAPENLIVLRSLSYSEEWLKKYLAGVIIALEGMEKHVVGR